MVLGAMMGLGTRVFTFEALGLLTLTIFSKREMFPAVMRSASAEGHAKREGERRNRRLALPSE
jgi:hypothetical protein